MAEVNEQRIVIKFLQKEGETAANVYRRLRKVYGIHSMSEPRVYEWFKRFRDGRTSAENDVRCGRPATAVTEENIEKVNKLILSDRRVRIQDIMSELQIGSRAVNDIIHNRLGYNKVCARWIPHQLTSDQKEARMNICQDLLEHYESDGDTFLHHIVTGDETWVHQFEPESKAQSMQWRHVKSPPPRKFKVMPSSKKVMATVFWDSSGVLLVDYLPQGQTINALRYSAVLKKLKRAITRKRPLLPHNQIFIQHDNARPHSALLTQQTIRKLGWTVLPHPPYSPDLAPSDYHLFGPLKQFLGGKHYDNIEAVQCAVQAWIRATPASFFQDGILKLVPRWQKCIVGEGDYVEK